VRIRLFAVLIVAVALLGAGCSTTSPKLQAGPPVSNGPVAPSTTTTTLAPPPTIPGTASSTPATVAYKPGDPCPVGPAPAVGTSTNVATTLANLKQVSVYPNPVGDVPCVTLDNPDLAFKTPLTFVVLQQLPGWAQILLPSKPNESVGWIRATDVEVTQHQYRIEVSLSGHRVKVFNGTRALVDTPAGVGTGDTPTPPGVYYTLALIKPTNGGYGPYAYALSGHSTALDTFAGGDGRIGLHGTDDPSSIGKDVSHGCIRIPNDVITRMAEAIKLPLGVPVVVTA